MLEKKTIDDLIEMNNFAIDVREKLEVTMKKQLSDHEAWVHQQDEYKQLELRYKNNERLLHLYKNLRVELRKEMK